LLDGTYDLPVGAGYLGAEEFFGLRCHGDISPRVAITGQVTGTGCSSDPMHVHQV
jgi:hypothetical protein